MDNGREGYMDVTESPVWISDPGHAWLRVPKEYVLESGYTPTEYSYLDQNYVYLEEDCDAPAYCKHVGIWDGERGSFPRFEEAEYTDGESRVRRLPRMIAFEGNKMYRQVLKTNR